MSKQGDQSVRNQVAMMLRKGPTLWRMNHRMSNPDEEHKSGFRVWRRYQDSGWETGTRDVYPNLILAGYTATKEAAGALGSSCMFSVRKTGYDQEEVMSNDVIHSAAALLKKQTRTYILCSELNLRPWHPLTSYSYTVEKLVKIAHNMLRQWIKDKMDKTARLAIYNDLDERIKSHEDLMADILPSPGGVLTDADRWELKVIGTANPLWDKRKDALGYSINSIRHALRDLGYEGDYQLSQKVTDTVTRALLKALNDLLIVAEALNTNATNVH